MITLGDLYTDYEKLFLPFDATTWALLLGTFAIAQFTILIVNRMSKRVQNIVYGEGINIPSLNIVSTFFGVSQPKLPIKTFPRFILIIFVLFCLIFRTAYQGVLFDFMTSDMRKPHAQTIDDLINDNFTIYSEKESTLVRVMTEEKKLVELILNCGKQLSSILFLVAGKK
jgi:hypothetical protein